MFIPDPTFSIPYPGFEFFPSQIPDTGSGSATLPGSHPYRVEVSAEVSRIEVKPNEPRLSALFCWSAAEPDPPAPSTIAKDCTVGLRLKYGTLDSQQMHLSQVKTYF
jgi:hypothetical protein